MISNEDKKDVKRAFGSKTAGAVAKATNDSRSKALHKVKNRFIDIPSGGRGLIKTATTEHTKHYNRKSGKWED